jgi:hypothetical protein
LLWLVKRVGQILFALLVGKAVQDYLLTIRDPRAIVGRSQLIPREIKLCTIGSRKKYCITTRNWDILGILQDLGDSLDSCGEIANGIQKCSDSLL